MKQRGHAIVLGGSMGGMLAARALANHFSRVTILERDEPNREDKYRRGVPQARHTHGLLAGGRRILEDYFPGLRCRVLALGGLEGDVVASSRWHLEGGDLARCDSGLTGYLASRPLLEVAVRAELRMCSRVVTHYGVAVDGLICEEDVIVGVRAKDREWRADLVVDATGRGSKVLAWLDAVGFAAPREERIEVGVTYTTRLFERRPEQLSGDLAAVVPATPNGKRGGVILAQEHDRWSVTLFDHFGSGAPADLNGFVEFARDLPAAHIFEAIRRAEPVGEAAISKFPASVRHRYEELTRFPEGLLPIGDAVCSFNPIYGQGVSVLAMEARTLDQYLRAHNEIRFDEYFRAIARTVEIPWKMAAGNDLRMPELASQATPASRLVNWYMAKLVRAGHQDVACARAFHEVSNLLAGPEKLFEPGLMARVLWRTLFPKRIKPESLKGAAVPA